MSNSTFVNKTAIVTGAARGIGFEICRGLAREGANVILNDIDPVLASEAASRLRAEGWNCTVCPGDSGDHGFIYEVTKKAVDEFGSLDIVVANAGITLFGEFLSYPAESFFKVLHVNLGGSFFIAQAAANIMKDQTGGGSILFMSSVTGHQAHKHLAAYGMTKAALEMLAKNLVIELSPFNINVNTIAPGATVTERTADDPGYESTWSRITPMGRPAYPADIANAALFLTSPASRHITGQTLIIDGGWTSVSPSPYDQ